MRVIVIFLSGCSNNSSIKGNITNTSIRKNDNDSVFALNNSCHVYDEGYISSYNEGMQFRIELEKLKKLSIEYKDTPDVVFNIKELKSQYK